MNQNYNFVRGLFSQVLSARNEEFANKKSISFKSLLLIVVVAFFASITSQGQTTLISPTGDGGFENGATLAANGWTVANYASSVNQWSIGTAVTATPFSNRSAYISINSGTSNTYDNASTNHVYLYRDVVIPAGSLYIPLSFNYISNGEASYDILQVFVAPTTVTPVAGASPGFGTTTIPTDITGATFLGFFQSVTTPQTGSLVIPSSFSGQTVRLIFMWKSDTSGGTSPPAAIDNISLTASNTLPLITSTALGGLWSSPATWVGGVLPNGTDVSIAAGSTVTVDQATSYRNIDINGTLQWNATTNAMTLSGNLKINSGGKFLPYITGGTGQTINIAGNFQNDGYTNLALLSTVLNFNGSGSTLSGTGIFEGDGTRGIIRTLTFSNLGSNSIATSQNLTLMSALNHYGGSLNTNGKIKIDNTAQIYGQALNLQVANVAVTNMGSLYTVAPVVFGTAVVPYANALAAVANTRYFYGNNVYLCTTAGTFNATPPTSTGAAVFTTSGPTLIWAGELGTLGTPLPFGTGFTLSLTTQYFVGNNVYQAILNTASTADFPTHTSGVARNLRWIGTVAKATVNYNAATGTVRSLNLTQAGSGFSTAPAVVISKGLGDTTGISAAATAVYFQQIIGPANSIVQKSGGAATITGGLTINNDQGASSIASTNVQASSGVGNISTTNGGLNYTVAPLVGFAGPPALNLVTNSGSGYTVAPTVTVTGGTLVSGNALATANFTITMNQGKVVSVYLNTATTATYSVPPTLAFSAGTATLAFPAGCWPTATANIGSNGQLTSFTITNSGYGYAAAPTVGVGTASGTLAGGNFTTVASAPAARIALYNLTLGMYAPTVAAVVATDDVTIPSNRKLNTLALSTSGMGLNLTNNLTLFGTFPLSLTATSPAPGNVLDLGGNNLLCTWNAYAGTTASTFGATNTYIKNGSMTLTGRGGGTTGSTFNFPFSGTVTVFTGGSGSTPVTAGTDVLTVKVTEVGAPSNTISGGTGIALGTRAFKIDTATTFGAAPTAATLFGLSAPTVKLNYNSSDALTYTQDQTFVSEATSINGSWDVRSPSVGASGALAATGSATTSIAAPGAIAFTSGNFYAWSTAKPTIAGVLPTVLCANSGAFSITGTNLTGVSDVKIGGTPVLSFTVVSGTSITGFAGNGTSGFISVTKNGVTVTGIENITISPSPIAPAVSVAAVSVNLGATITVTASGGSGTFKWYDAVSGGNLLYTGPTFSAPVCSGNLWVAENNGSCEGLRNMVTITTAPTAIVSSATSFCGAGSPVTLTASPADATITYSWSSLTAPATVAPAIGASSVTSTLSQTSDFRLTATKGACTAQSNISIGVYALPSATVTTTAQGVCPGTGATIGSGLVAGNFAVTSVPYIEYLPPANAVVVASAGVVNLPLTGGTLDDGGWSGLPIGFNFNFFGTNFNTISAGTNGLLMFGTPPGYGTGTGQLGQFTFNTTGGVFPNTANPGNVISLMAADQNFGSGTSSTLSYWTQGYAPNRIFIIEYNKVNPYGNSSTNFTAQARLYETLGTVDISIITRTATNSATVGLQDATKTIGAVAPGRQSFTSTITTPETWRFAPPANYTTSWSANGVLIPSVTANPSAVPPVVGFTNPGTNVFNLAVAPSATTTYSISYVNQTTGCTNAAGSAQVVMTVLGNTVPAGLTTIASATTICIGQTVNFSTSYTGITDGMVFQWQNSTDGGTTWTDITLQNGITYSAIPTVTSQYRCKMIACNGAPGYTSAVTIGFTNAILTTTPGLRCGTGTAIVGATGSTGATVKWYANASGGASLGTGTSFTTPIISANTSYYAGAETFSAGSFPVGLGGTLSSSSGQSFFPGFWGGSKTQYIIKADELIAAGIGAGNITSLGFEPSDSGQTYQGFSVSLAPVTTNVMTTTFVSSGLTQVYTGTLADNGFTPVANTVNNLAFGTGTGSATSFNWDGSSNVLVSIAWTSVPAASTGTGSTMKVDNVGFVSSAYDLADNLTPAEMLASATADATTSFRPRFTINGQVVCSSPRVPVLVTVNAPPAIALSGNPATICTEQTSTAVTVVTGGSNYDTYVWTPSATVTGNATTGWSFNPLSTTTYTLAVSQSTGLLPCSNTASITVATNPTPSVLTISPTPGTVCIDTVLPLVTSGGTVGSTGAVKIGSGVLTNTTSTPYRVFYGGSKTQSLYTAAELSALGLISGSSISSIGHVILSGTPLLMNNYSISVGFVSDVTLGTAFISGSTTTILNNVAYTPPTGTGNIDYTLATPIVWNGVSNLLVETCFNNNDGGGGSVNSLSVESTTVPTGLNLYRSLDNTVDVCSNTTGFGTTTRPNLRIFVMGQVGMTWSPTTNLYSDAAATIPYTGGNATTVYVKSSTGVPTTTYTASATSSLGCVRTATIPVTIYQTLAPTGTQSYQFCSTSGATVNDMSALLVGTGINWYSSATGGTQLPSTTALTQGYYWASQTANGCESQGRFPVFAISNVISSPSSNPSQQFCNSATVANLTATGTALKWYNASTGGVALATSSPLVSGTYYVSQTLGGCESPRTAVAVNVNVVSAPTGAATQSLSSLLTIGDIVVFGSNVVWYSSSANAASGTNPLSPTQLLTNTTYYATQTISGCTSATSLAVTISTLADQDFDMTQFSYYPNPVINLLNISYSQEMTNVKVYNMVGQQLLNKNVNATSTKVDMSGFANGAYFIKVSTENATKTVRVIKK